jgi:precorrin-3B synthase
MSAPFRRGACPSLAAPMLTGDGWLARLAVSELTAGQLAGLAAVAARLGNGLVEVTARGSLQVRGLTPGSAEELWRVLDDLGVVVAEGLRVVTGPLAGIDPGEVADPRPLAAALREGAAGLALLPKVSVVIDGGGALHLDAVPADLRLIAVWRDSGAAVPAGRRPSRGRLPRWLVAVGEGRVLGVHDADAAVRAALALLQTLAERRARGRDLPVAGPLLPVRAPAEPVGRFGPARGLGLPFGQGDAPMLAGLAAAAGAGRVRPAPGRALVVVGADDDAALLAAARRLRFVVEPGDPRRAVVACSGAPACGSALLPTRAVAEAVTGIADGWTLHLSGCGKRCAQPAGPAVTLVGTARGWELTGEGMAVPAGLAARLAPIVGRHG